MRFGLFCPDIAERETRLVTVPDPIIVNGRLILPADVYAFDEWYCEEPNCDCRRVMFNVIAEGPIAHLATKNYAFDPPTGHEKILGQTMVIQRGSDEKQENPC